jgi:hypothetical protein
MYERDIHEMNKEIFEKATEGIVVSDESGFLDKYK